MKKTGFRNRNVLHVNNNNTVKAEEEEKNQYRKKTKYLEPRLEDVDQEIDETAPSVSYFSIFRYATKWDKLRFFLALLSAVITGVVLPFNTIVFADITNAMVIYGITLSMDVTVPNAEEDFHEAVKWFGIYNTILGTILVVFSYTATVLMNHTAFNQIYRIRKEYMRAALNQDISWYDLNESGDFASRMSEDLVKLEDGMGEKITNCVHFIVGFISSVVMALIRGWKLALVCLTSFPLTLLCVGTAGAIAARLAKKEAVAYGHAASVAEEVLGSIRTVAAFGGQRKETERFQENLGQAKAINIKRNFFSGLALGALFFCIYSTYALSFWYGVKLVIEEPETYTVDIMVSVFFGIMMGSMQFGMMSPLIEVFGVSKGAAAKVFALIDTVPYINAFLDRGVKPSEVLGNITFKNVHFRYPSRDDVTILTGVNLEVKRGQTVALVGTSGCGKSTVIQLIQRFYDPNDGNIHLDGNDIRDLSVNWLRSQIGVVGQEPVLFNTTIDENIRYGHDEATQEQIEEAAKKSNAHEFIKQLPKGYKTVVGDRGTQLSGGQKQRIAIARALVRNPTILLLDEATSALDTHSESKVQNALDKASRGRTTIIVAHRLSTIRNADVIYAFKDGSVAETGSHQQLMDMKGIYYDMVMMQNVPSALNNNNDQSLLSKQESIISSQSDTSEDVPKEEVVADEEREESAAAVPFLKIVALSKPEWRQLLVACLASAILGFAMPVFAILFGEILGVLSNPDRDYVRQQTNFYSLMFVMLGILSGISNFISIFLYGIAGERLTERLRRQMFEAMLRQEIGWFDDKKNSTGALCAKLSSEATYVQGATGQRIGTVMQGVSTLGLGVGLAMYYEWRVGLVSFCFTPLIIVVMYRQALMAISKETGISKTVEKSTKLAIEVISNIRTVASLGREAQFLDQYDAELAPGVRIAQRATHSRGLVFGLSRGIMNYAFAAAIYYGGILIINDGVSYQNVLKTSQALIMSTTSVANMFAFAPNFQRGVFAAGRIIALLKRQPAIVDPPNPAKTVFDASGNVSYEDIHFSYPSRSGMSVLNGLSLAIEPGRTVALVGASGCGKSTVVQLLERFYDPDSGTVKMDGTSTKDLPLSELRKNLGLVQQEPVLFDRSIGENIAYGDNERTPSQTEIVEAAKKANIHNFITSLPLGYDTRLGSKGTQLSGGQKQRVAIARALLRQPKLLLLDEATSALDVESEKVVQEALDAAKVGRTCIIIAHRLFTVRDADVICVLQGGRVAEMGLHQELVNARGIYYRLQLRSTI